MLSALIDSEVQVVGRLVSTMTFGFLSMMGSRAVSLPDNSVGFQPPLRR
jgi:hypothetical protein